MSIANSHSPVAVSLYDVNGTLYSASAAPAWASAASGSIGASLTDLSIVACTLGGYYFYNSTSAVAYVQFFDALHSSVTLGTTAPKLSLGIPAGGAANLNSANGLTFTTALCIAITTTRAGSIAPAATVDYNLWFT